MKIILFLIISSLLGYSYFLHAQSPEMAKFISACDDKDPADRANIGISKFFESAHITDVNMGGITIANKIIAHIAPIKCFNTETKIAYYVPDQAQAIITGDIKDYYSSEKAFGVPRLNFVVELRNATTMQIIDTCTVNLKGKLYKGFGKNKALEELWQKSLDSVASFLFKHSTEIASLKKANSEKVAIGEKVLEFSNRVETEGPLQSQQRYNEAMRERNRNWALNLSTYYNDSIIYKEFPKIAADQFLEYTVDGKKYQFYSNSKDINKIARFSSIEGLNFAREGMRITISPSTVVQQIRFQMFYPADYPTLRRFHFGNDSTVDERIPSGKKNISFIADLLGNIKPAMVNSIAGAEYKAYASNKAAQQENVNVDKGYLQVLHFETGNYGVLECYFKLHTKAGKDKNGKPVPAHNIEGRFRCRGQFRARGM